MFSCLRRSDRRESDGIGQVLKVSIFVIYLQFFKENIRYPVWTCRDAISLIQRTWWQFFLISRDQIFNFKDPNRVPDTP